ncbi:hypothetical protein RIF29_20732 [Crotalaria pallida]|uniref:Mediator complex subunit 15 KIX domain-containing protein n=1 Tax=Crotalaria pallida TaxID=3830 RepID=A0AAN9F628_CROPI
MDPIIDAANNNTVANGWKTTENRKKMVKEIEELLIKQDPNSQTQDISKCMKYIERFEEKVFASTKDEAEYIEKISAMKMLHVSTTSECSVESIDREAKAELEENYQKVHASVQDDAVIDTYKYFKTKSELPVNVPACLETLRDVDQVSNMNMQDSSKDSVRESKDSEQDNSKDSKQDALVRLVFAIVLQNPGISEDAIMKKMNNMLDPKSFKTMLDLMIRDKHLTVKKTYEDTVAAVPSFLRGLLASNKRICKEHFFANLNSSLL